MYKRQQSALLNNKKWLAFILVSLWSITGCSWLYQEKFKEPKFDLRGKSIFIPDFAKTTSTGKLWYYESVIDGRMMAEFARDALQNGHCDLDVYRGKEVPSAMVSDFSDPPPWTKWGEMAEVDYIMLGTIEKLTYKDRTVIGISQASLHLTLKLWDVKRKKPAKSFSVQVNYPKNPGDPDGSTFDQNRKGLRQHVFGHAAAKIQSLFCGKTVPIGRKEVE